LTVAHLRDQRLQENPPFLGYLSACLTGANEADTLIDEGIHLVSACQLAGFRHVVGTLWEVSDRHCVDVARVLYETIRDEGMTDVALYRGLHRAVRALRDRHKERGGNNTTGTTAVHHNGMETGNVDGNRSETIREDGNRTKVANEDILPDTIKADDGGPAMTTQTDGLSTCAKEEIEVVNTENVKPSDGKGRTVDNEDNRTQVRKAELYGYETQSQEMEQESPLYWAPYIHFGV